jgi:hypothetical protein
VDLTRGWPFSIRCRFLSWPAAANQPDLLPNGDLYPGFKLIIAQRCPGLQALSQQLKNIRIEIANK